jgi:ribosomal protein S21
MEIREVEPLSKQLRLFKKLLERSGAPWEVYKHRYRLKPCEERRRKLGNAKINARKAAYRKRRQLGI